MRCKSKVLKTILEISEKRKRMKLCDNDENEDENGSIILKEKRKQEWIHRVCRVDTYSSLFLKKKTCIRVWNVYPRRAGRRNAEGQWLISLLVLLRPSSTFFLRDKEELLSVTDLFVLEKTWFFPFQFNLCPKARREQRDSSLGSTAIFPWQGRGPGGCSDRRPNSSGRRFSIQTIISSMETGSMSRLKSTIMKGYAVIISLNTYV